MSERSIVGDLINFRGLVYAPLNEQGVVFLFGKIAHDLNMYVEEIKPGFPDCIARRFVGKGWERVRIEFEYRSSNFLAHKHDAEECDVIVCWEHDWKGSPLEVIELSSEIKSLPNPKIERPGGRDNGDDDPEEKLTAMFLRLDARPEVRLWFERILEELRRIESAIWLKVGEKYIGWYCPERAFVSMRPTKNALVIDCFSRGETLPGARVLNAKLSPRWARFRVKSDADVDQAVGTLIESMKRIKEAIRAGEPTNMFSGQVEGPEGPEEPAEDIEDDDA